MQRLAALQVPVNPSASTSVSSRYEIVEPRASHSTVAGNLTSIGEGAYGVVYKARDTVTGRFVALKKIKLENESDGISSSTLREITLLMQVNHENIVKLENVIFERERMCLIFELLEVDLRRYLDQMQGLMEEDEVRVSIHLLCWFFGGRLASQRVSFFCSLFLRNSSAAWHTAIPWVSCTEI